MIQLLEFPWVNSQEPGPRLFGSSFSVYVGRCKTISIWYLATIQKHLSVYSRTMKMTWVSNTVNGTLAGEGRNEQRIHQTPCPCWKAWISFKGPNSVMNLFLIRANHRLFLERIRKATAGIFLSGPGHFHLWLLPAHPAHWIFPPSSWFPNPSGRVGDEGELDSFLSRPVLSSNPVFDFRVDRSFSLRFGRLDPGPKAGSRKHSCLGLYGRDSKRNLVFGSALITTALEDCLSGKYAIRPESL